MIRSVISFLVHSIPFPFYILSPYNTLCFESLLLVSGRYSEQISSSSIDWICSDSKSSWIYTLLSDFKKWFTWKLESIINKPFCAFYFNLFLGLVILNFSFYVVLLCDVFLIRLHLQLKLLMVMLEDSLNGNVKERLLQT